MELKLSDYIWRYIEELGVKHVFMFPGGGAMHLVDSLSKNKNIEYINLMHEQACAMASETYSRISENIGVSLVTTGPGGTNAVTGVAAAWLESTPCIFISGQVKTTDLKSGTGLRQKGNQEIGIVDIVSSITKYAKTITKAEEIKYHLDKAIYLAKEGRQGPVWLDIPLDVQATIIETDKLNSFKAEDFCNKYDDIKIKVKETLDILKGAKKPVLIVGQGIQRNSGKQLFEKLVKILKIPVLTSWIGTELLEFENEYNMGKPGMVAPRYSNFTMQNADCIIAIGTRLDPSMIGYNQNKFASNAKKIIVDIDETEINKLDINIEVSAVCDATNFIEEMIRQIEKNCIELDVQKWNEVCRNWKSKYPLILDKYRMQKDLVNPYYFIERLSESLEEDDIILPGSSGAGIDIFWMAFKNKKKQRLLATGSLGSMGYGIPASIGGCLASGGKRTICIEGDGSLQLNIQELATIKGLNLPIKIFVMNNGGYLSIMNMQKTHFNGNLVASNKNSKLFIPNIEKIAEAYGLSTFRIENHSEIDKVIDKVLKVEGPVLCNVTMSSELSIQPKVMSKVLENGMIESGRLEDLFPFLDKEEFEENMNIKI